MTTRILFLARYRVPHACMSLRFDANLIGVDRTIVATPMSRDELEPVWENHGIDSSGFEYVSDSEIYHRYPQVNDWVFPDDYRGWWLRQQAIKLSYLDYLDYDVALMQDPDTFLTRPYQPWDGDRITFCALENTTHGSYQGMIESIFGFPRQTNHCFITEFVPCVKQDITNMRIYLEQRHGCDWLTAMIDNTTRMPTIPPWGSGEIIRWFSEYEVIGNWTMRQRPVEFWFQRRFEYDSLDRLVDLDKGFNAVADAIPDLSLSLHMDWDTGRVKDYDRWMSVISERL